MLKPQDILILAKALLLENGGWTYRQLADELEMSVSATHDGVARAETSHLFDTNSRTVIRRNLVEFIEHGIRYVFPPEQGSMTRGIPTAHAAPPLSEIIQRPDDVPPPVWPYAHGDTPGYSVRPLYSSVPQAALNDQDLYEVLALIDAIRIGRARERSRAADLLRSRLLHSD